MDQAWARLKKAAISNQKISYWFLKVRNLYRKILYQNWIAYFNWTGTKPTVSKTYDTIFSDTKYQRCYFEMYQNIIIFLLQLSVSNCFKPIVPFCVRVLPIVITWNRVFLSEFGGKLRLCFGKMTWNRVFLSETGEKLRLCLKLIISESYLFVNMKWLQFKISWFMTIYIRKTKVFIKSVLRIVVFISYHI
jgi:hypothetical protein